MSIFFFFKQKTAYEMRISDWSSDVCSSDLGGIEHRAEHVRRTPQVLQRQLHEQRLVALPGGGLLADAGVVGAAVADRLVEDRRIGCQPGDAVLVRSEEHTSELQSLMRISYAVFCLKKKTKIRPIMQ